LEAPLRDRPALLERRPDVPPARRSLAMNDRCGWIQRSALAVCCFVLSTLPNAACARQQTLAFGKCAGLRIKVDGRRNIRAYVDLPAEQSIYRIALVRAGTIAPSLWLVHSSGPTNTREVVVGRAPAGFETIDCRVLG
jgi:hypothetical protein